MEVFNGKILGMGYDYPNRNLQHNSETSQFPNLTNLTSEEIRFINWVIYPKKFETIKFLGRVSNSKDYCVNYNFKINDNDYTFRLYRIEKDGSHCFDVNYDEKCFKLNV